MQPILLYYEDPYIKEANAKVIKIEDNLVWLDKTIFYAEKGGQESDTGWINNIRVIDVRSSDYAHVLERNPDFSVDDIVHLKLDWDRRYKIMRLHSALHLVYFVVKELIGDLKVIGSHVGPDKARIDYAFEGSIGKYLPEIQERVNEIIREDREIIVYEKEPSWRIWKMGDWEDPCAGTHVRRTGEIGEVKLKRRNLGRGKERIEVYLLK